MTTGKRRASVGTLLLGVLWAPGTLASTTFPEALRQELGLAELAGPAPGCRLCHQDDAGGLKTATKPFGRSLMQAGLTAANVPSLRAALGTLEAQGTDSDRDGVPDIAELESGEDPNRASGDPAPVAEVPLPQTGCGVVGSLGTAHSSGAVALLAGLAAARRRPRRAGSSPARRLRQG